MANRTVKDAVSIKGTNPQYLVEKIIRSRIYDCRYWKEECFALTAELLVDKAIEIKYIGGVFGGNIKPTPFICLILKMLQIQPEKDIIIEFICNEKFKYVRFLGAFYMRLTGSSLDVHKYLEPLYIDYRKMKRLNRSGKFELVHMDEMIDELLHGERVCDVALPRLQKRHVLEELNKLEIRISPLEENLDEIESSESEEEEERKENVKETESKKSNDKRSSSRRSPIRDRSPVVKHEKRKYIDYDNPQHEAPRYRHSKSRSPSSRRRRSKSNERKKESTSRHRDRHDHHDNESRERERKHKKKNKRKRSHSKEKSDDKKSKDKKDKKDKHSK